MGIELHWIDALTGGDLNRWFPLAAPSDYLYFLPQRPGIDSKKKLRLISSAAGPVAARLIRSDSTPAKWKYWPTPPAFGRRQSLTRLFFGNMPFPAPSGDPDTPSDGEQSPGADGVQGILRTVDCDHFHAIPVSDGTHLIFTDPASGLLCLGSDAPLGGPTKLLRKVLFVPPAGEGERSSLPLRYAVGRALDWGLRVMVVYDNSQIVLYSMPSDVFNQLRHYKGTTDIWDENSGVLGQSDLIMDTLMASRGVDPASDEFPNDPSDDSSDFAHRALPLTGSIVMNVTGRTVDDVVVDSDNGGLRVWVFFRNGLAELYNIYTPRGHRTRKRYVGDNGLIYDKLEMEQDGDQVEHRESTEKREAREDAKHVKWAGQSEDEE